MPIRLLFIDAGVGGATGSGSIASVSLGPPNGSASASSVASGALVAIALGVLTATAVGTSNGSASGSLASVALSVPTGSATGTSGGSATATGALSALALSAPTASASASSVASGSIHSVSLSAPSGYAYVPGAAAVVRGSIASVSYVPGIPPENLDDVRRFLSDELGKVAAAIALLSAGHIDQTTVSPARPREGDIRLADGSSWNPGSGQGVYAYYNSAWHLLG